MKYTFEIMKEYEDAFRGISVYSVSEDKKLMVDFVAREELEDAQKQVEEAYQRGLEDGKAQDNHGCEGCEWEGSPFDACERCCNNYKNMWQAKDDKIVVGDEVYCKDDDVSDSGVVTWVGKDSVYAMWQDGSAGEVQKDELIKTGRHFDIAKILEDMRND